MLKKNYTNDVLTAVFLNLLGFAEPIWPKKNSRTPIASKKVHRTPLATKQS